MRLAVLAAACLSLASGGVSAQPAPPPVSVGVAVVEERPVADMLSVIGRVAGSERVEVRARVSGFLEAVGFTEGGLVQSGDALYSIERGSFEAAVQRAAGVLAQQEAARDLAQIQLARAQELFERQAGTAVARDQAKAEFDRAIGAVQQAEADLASARIDLGYTEIRAPIAGRIGRTAFTDGALVGPDFGVMTIVVKEDPMHVDFPIAVRDFLASGGQGAAERVRVTLTQPNGSTYPHEARIDFADVTVNQSADTVTVRAVVPNPDRGLIDGQLVTVTLAPRNPEMRPVIPQQAMLADREGLYVFTVQDGRAAVRRVRPGQGSGGDVPILEGLAKGDVVIVEGIERVRPGAPVTAQPMQRVGG